MGPLHCGRKPQIPAYCSSHIFCSRSVNISLGSTSNRSGFDQPVTCSRTLVCLKETLVSFKTISKPGLVCVPFLSKLTASTTPICHEYRRKDNTTYVSLSFSTSYLLLFPYQYFQMLRKYLIQLFLSPIMISILLPQWNDIIYYIFIFIIELYSHYMNYMNSHSYNMTFFYYVIWHYFYHSCTFSFNFQVLQPTTNLLFPQVVF